MARLRIDVLLLVLVGVLFVSGAAYGAETAPPDTDEGPQVMSGAVFGMLGALLGAGVIVAGAAFGIGKIAVGATEAISRQPEAGGRIFTSMVIAASLIEGLAFFGLIVCFVAIFRMTP